MVDELYSERILALGRGMSRVGRLQAPHATVEKRSAICGSRVRVDLVFDGERLADYAHEVRACALGSAAAAVMAAHGPGATRREIAAARAALAAMLREGGPPPEPPFDDLRWLAPARDFPSRHASVMLAFDAVMAGFEGAAQKGERE